MRLTALFAGTLAWAVLPRGDARAARIPFVVGEYGALQHGDSYIITTDDGEDFPT